MPNAECGMDRANVERRCRHVGIDVALQFRIPNSAFRIGSSFHIPHSAFCSSAHWRRVADPTAHG